MKLTIKICCVGLFLFPGLGAGQYISLKSIPVASGDQFLVRPSLNLGMGGVGIAMSDSLFDPFVNPAKGSRLPQFTLFSSPTFYKISDNNGSAKTLPSGFLFNSGEMFGGASFAIQQLSAPNDQTFGPWGGLDRAVFAPQSQTLLSDKNANNSYLSGFIGLKIPGTELSLGTNLFWANLNAVDGVELLYANSNQIEQYGDMLDFRFGLLSESGQDRNIELLVLHNRFDMTHDVTYRRWILDEQQQTGEWRDVVERNLDHTRTWGLHLGYDQMVTENGLRFGGIVTANRKTHPKLPNYELMNIPRDPGITWAYNFGLGVSDKNESTTFGADFIFEPIWSNTWADAIDTLTTASGAKILPGNKTINNKFRFSNWILRLGLDYQEKVVGFQVGLQAHWTDYRLNQEDRVAETKRTQRENWVEWTPTFGLSLKLPDFELKYNLRVTTGTGRPGVRNDGRVLVDGAERAASADFIPAPSGALTLAEANVYTHQVALIIPIK